MKKIKKIIAELFYQNGPQLSFKIIAIIQDDGKKCDMF